MVYNLTGIGNNAIGLLGFTQGVNDVLMGGWLGTMFLIAISTIIFLTYMFRTGDAQKSMAAASFISFGLSIFLGALNLLPDMVMFIALILSAITLAVSFKNT